MLVFAECSLELFLIMKGVANAYRGVVVFIDFEKPVGGTWGRL